MHGQLVTKHAARTEVLILPSGGVAREHYASPAVFPHVSKHLWNWCGEPEPSEAKTAPHFSLLGVKHGRTTPQCILGRTDHALDRHRSPKGVGDIIILPFSSGGRSKGRDERTVRWYHDACGVATQARTRHAHACMQTTKQSFAPVALRAGQEPGAKDGLDGQMQLFVRVRGHAHHSTVLGCVLEILGEGWVTWTRRCRGRRSSTCSEQAKGYAPMMACQSSAVISVSKP